jgi:hypothetical protein
VRSELRGLRVRVRPQRGKRETSEHGASAHRSNQQRPDRVWRGLRADAAGATKRRRR